MGSKPKTCLLIIVLQIINFATCQEEDKRAQFFGMRGKKYYDEYEPYYKRKPNFFVGVKGKKNLLDILADSYYKRAPMGFVGMRGKKDYLEDIENLPPSGSLIGRIDYTADDAKTPSEYSYLTHMLSDYLRDVADPTNTDANDIGEIISQNPERISNEVEKRAANYKQFFGVRGKKSVQNKRPFDVNFRGKFIGVRGKKDVKSDQVQEIRFLLEHAQPWQKRKGQVNGFFGMRGKKWTEDSTQSAESIENTNSV